MTAIPALVGGGGDIITLNNANVTDSNPGNSVAGWRIDADGGVYEARAGVSGGAYIKQYDWCIPNGNAANYECKWEVNNNTPDVSPASAGTWVQCNVDRTWEEINPAGAESATIDVSIRRVGGGATLATCTITLDVDGSP